METMTSKDVIGTAELNKELKKLGHKFIFGASTLTVVMLEKRGFKAVLKLPQGIYWNRSIVNELDEMLKNNTKNNNETYANNEIVHSINENFEAFGEDVYYITQMLEKIMNELGIKL